MTYEPNTPQSTDSLGSAQSKILTNFQQIAVVNAINHVAFNDAGKGKHKFLQMPEQASAPTTAINEAGFYSKVGPNPAQTNLFFRGENSGYEYQLTRAISASTGSFAGNGAYAAGLLGGWTFLPGNLLLQYGSKTTPGSSGTVTFPVAFTTDYFSITIGVARDDSNSAQNIYIDRSVAVSLTSFAYTSTNSSSRPLYWMAIGI